MLTKTTMSVTAILCFVCTIILQAKANSVIENESKGFSVSSLVEESKHTLSLVVTSLWRNIMITSFVTLLIVAYLFPWNKLFSLLPPSIRIKAIKLQRQAVGYFVNPDELIALIKFIAMRSKVKKQQKSMIARSNPTPNTLWCYKKLNEVSRSFSAVIMALHPELRDAVCVFYLVLRGLDTIEDDMKIHFTTKKEQLLVFHEHLDEQHWNIKGYGDKASEIDLLEKFDKVIAAYSELKPEYREVIQTICKTMAEGMSKFITKPVITCADYDEYCHYVAGLVGIGLSQLWGHSGLEKEDFKFKSNNNINNNNDKNNIEAISNSMGLFLQKTNIVRDFLEDISEDPPRVWYPKDIWSKHVDNVHDLLLPNQSNNALNCLNEMVENALLHCVDCLEYLALLRDPTVFSFCAIPQVMAIATLNACYNNYDVFLYEVKIRKGEAVKLMLKTRTMQDVLDIMSHYLNEIAYKASFVSNNKKILQIKQTVQSKINAVRNNFFLK